MLTRDAMHAGHSCRPDATISTAARVMRDGGTPLLSVIDDRGSLVGVLTREDLVSRHLAEGLPLTSRVSEIMTRDVLTCGPDEDLTAVSRKMAASGRSRWPVVDSKGHVVGVLASGRMTGTDVGSPGSDARSRSARSTPGTDNRSQTASHRT